ncbi:SusC/RagA family TonB-linked outer membrane protein [Carboxylicivirga marina]|uniref:SusC/RagA family TonB-linked outer membrane protein n=1 Tax=Carboxylicivirga marina TaxID=2800988 RepID=UPI0025971D9B|nr:TonB-dependent receptor [uncultured Carboxylicivirga sp.]
MRRLALIASLILFVGLNAVFAQTTTITGAVTDSETGEAMPGVSVVVRGTTIGTVTNVDGNYSLSVPNDATNLLYSFVGMKTQDILIDGRSTINVVLESDAIGVDEVIVVAYGTSTKGSFTGSAAVVDAEVIEKRQVSNISNALAGSVAGVQVLNSNGQPGTGSTVRVRGVGSINAGMNPLYVVDGIPFDGDLSSIASSDIETMTVLKDAASTALYGARGANGIIMITTKKGKKGQAQINLDVRYGVNSRAVENYDVYSDPATMYEKTYAALYSGAINWLDMDAAAAHDYANATLITPEEGGLGYQMYTLPDGQSLIGTDGMLNPNATLGYSDGDYYYTPDNWADEMFQNNPRQEINLSMTGGTEKGSYYLSFNYLDDQGVIEGSGFNRISGRFKGDHKIKEWLKVGANVSINNITSDYPGEQTSTTSSGNAFFIANYISPIYPLYVRDGSTKEIMMNNGRKVYDYGDGVSTNMDRPFMAIANPAADLIYNHTDYGKDIVNSSWFAELSPIEGLKINARYGLNLDNTKYNDLGNAYMGQSAAYGGTAYQEQTRTVGFNQQYVANYQFTAGDMNQFDITAGYDGYTWERQEIFASGQNLYNPESYYVSNAIDQLRGGGDGDEYSTEGIFTRVNYSRDDTYFFNVAFRRDASSRFNPDNRWGSFWSTSAAWMLTNEEFMNGVSFVNMLKLKASYGEQGNDQIGNYYAWMDQYEVSGADGVFSDGSLTYKGNKDLTWETSTSYNIGVDFAMFDNRFTGTVEYFGRKSTDMLYYNPVTAIAGFTQIPMNIGSMTNSGLELDFNYSIISNANITWNVNANATMIKNKINELHPDLEGELIDGTRIYEEEESMYRMFLVDWAGVDSETGEALYWAEDENGEAIKTMDYSLASDYKVSTDDLLADVYGGFGTSFEGYGFDASLQFSYQLGGQIYDTGYRRLMHGGIAYYSGQNWHTDIEGAWTPDNTDSQIPRLNTVDKYANSTSTRWLTSSDYLSLNNITIGYTLPRSLFGGLNIDKLRIYFTAENVALWTAREGLDPRQSYISATTARYTPIRTISGGLNLVF